MRKLITVLAVLILGFTTLAFGETKVNVLTKSQKALIINQFDLSLVKKERVPSEKLTAEMAAAIVVASEYGQVICIISDDDADADINFVQLDDDGIYVYKYECGL